MGVLLTRRFACFLECVLPVCDIDAGEGSSGVGFSDARPSYVGPLAFFFVVRVMRGEVRLHRNCFSEKGHRVCNLTVHTLTLGALKALAQGSDVPALSR